MKRNIILFAAFAMFALVAGGSSCRHLASAKGLLWAHICPGRGRLRSGGRSSG